MLADVDEPVDADDPPRVVLRAAADAGDERIPGRELAQLARASARARDASSGRSTIGASVPSTSSRSPVAPGCSRDPVDEVARVHPHRENRRVPLVLIGLVAGFFSALFGVGGGIVVVPLLLLVGRFRSGRAMATSLAAIGIIALAGTISYAFHGEVKPGATRRSSGCPPRSARSRGPRSSSGSRAARSRSPSPLLLAGVGVWLLV